MFASELLLPGEGLLKLLNCGSLDLPGVAEAEEAVFELDELNIEPPEEDEKGKDQLEALICDL